MVVIKRVKGPPPGPMDAITGRAAPAVHWAQAFDPLGNVTAWTPERAQATEFSEQDAAKVLAYYTGRLAAGKVTSESTDPPKPEPVKQEAKPDPVKAEVKSEPKAEQKRSGRREAPATQQQE